MLFQKNQNTILIEQLENVGMLDMMLHQWNRFQSVQNYINKNACWQKWIRR